MDLPTSSVRYFQGVFLIHLLHIVFLGIISVEVYATTFAMQTVDEQIKSADGVVIGNYLGSQAIELESGKLATQMIFKVQSEWGMQSDLFGLDEVIVHYPGGVLNERKVHVQGVPSFVVGEKVALLTRNIENRYWGLNLGFGSFKVVNYGNETMLINSLFPKDARVGQVKLSVFHDKVKFIKGSSLKMVKHENVDKDGRLPASEDMGQNRSVATSELHEDNKEDQSSLSVYWLIAILAIVGGITRLRRARGT